MYGHHLISDEDIAALRKLSEECGGWILFDDVEDEVFIPLSEWERVYEKKKSSGGATDLGFPEP